MMPTHRPVGNPCGRCGKKALSHRPYHKPTGPVCECGALAKNHRVEHVPDGEPCSCGVSLSNHKKAKKHDRKLFYMGIDGEGQGRVEHKYILLAASNESGTKQFKVENPNGLSTEECLNFIISLPADGRLFAFSFGYDLTKILQDVSNEVLYKLFRPELRPRSGPLRILGPKPIKWKKWRLNLQGTKFTIFRKKKRRVIWDIFKFYQSKFVTALKDWKVGDPALIKRMSEMKDKRSEFDKVSLNDITKYCFDECRHMAELARKLTEAHEAVGLRLTGYYGAGSSASAMLKIMSIKDKIVAPPEAMSVPVSCAFFGGRFENSRIGTVEGPIYSYDISSAYPYQLCFLPCLEHARWEHTTSRSDIFKGKTALIQYRFTKAKPSVPWGPFPFRLSDGTITYPHVSGGGWVWKDEFLQGEKLFDNVQFVSAWVCYSNCECRPFDQIPRYYLERIRIGKEGPGIVIKLAMNSNYGKLAQSVGNAIFNSWAWAGMVTSGTRAQILEIMGLHHDLHNLLMCATDGIYTKERIETPTPKDTGTTFLQDGRVNAKPLGGWEEKIIEQGVFMARPGIYYPLNPTDEQLKDVRGRGIGKSVVLQNWERIIEAYDPNDIYKTIRVCEVTRFIGAKSAISRSGVGTKDLTYNRSDRYGQWITRVIEMSFDPMPKRESVIEGGKLQVRAIPRTEISSSYSKTKISLEAKEMYLAQLEASEQPDGGDLSDYELEDRI